jgi:XTP/dITP diphosphohydrolase
MKILIASQNQHKIEEIKAFLDFKVELISMSEMGIEEDIPETGQTLSENSLLKAQYLANKFDLPCLADDSGLEVEALNGAPGVFSARYAGEEKDDQKNMNLLLDNLRDLENKNARFVTVLTFHFKGEFHQFEGEIKGRIISNKRGNQGFGYDPIFIPEGFEKTFGEMSLAEKNTIAHRARALEKFKIFLKKQVIIE